MSTVRSELAASLKPLVPKTWKIVPYQTNLDSFTKPVVMLKQGTIERAPASPQGRHLVKFTVTIADPHLDLRLAEDALDDEVDQLIFALDELEHLHWTLAEKVLFQDTYLAYDLALEVLSKKKEE